VGYTESGLPIVEQIRPGVWAVGGYNGTGNVIGALCARAAADAAVGIAPTFLQLIRG
jgi:glycine/D-amino acid oxidase-like deaminating enzyme